MNDATPALYGELAEWWPLISPPEEYEEEAAVAADLLDRAAHPVRTVLELGSGGGHNASHLSEHFRMTLVDLSPGMLEVSRSLNPGCEHHLGDMRKVRLGRLFDAVFVHDAVMYLTTAVDLRAAFETAFEHCRPGGVAVFCPDDLAETFEPLTEHGGVDGPDGRSARYLEWSWDPDPSDTVTRTEYVIVIRESAIGSCRVVHETHHSGLFDRATWISVLRDVGFEPEIVLEPTPADDRRPRELFVARRPSPV